MSSDDADQTPSFTFEQVEMSSSTTAGATVSIHEKGAEALYAALGDPSEPDTGHALLARLYGEYAGSLEMFGALRSGHPLAHIAGSLIRTYVTFRTDSVNGFYTDVGLHAGDLGDLLRLPRADTIIAGPGGRLTSAPSRRDLGKCRADTVPAPRGGGRDARGRPDDSRLRRSPCTPCRRAYSIAEWCVERSTSSR